MNNGTTDVTVSGMTNTDSWTVLIVPQNTNNLGSLYSVRTAKGTNKFTVTNSTSGSGSTTYDYWVLTT